MNKLIDADKLREQIENWCCGDIWHNPSPIIRLIDKAPDLSLTWEDMQAIVKIADELADYAEVGIIEPFLSSEESYYKEVLKRFNEQR